VEDNFFSSAWTASLCGFLVSVVFFVFDGFLDLVTCVVCVVFWFLWFLWFLRFFVTSWSLRALVAVWFLWFVWLMVFRGFLVFYGFRGFYRFYSFCGFGGCLVSLACVVHGFSWFLGLLWFSWFLCFLWFLLFWRLVRPLWLLSFLVSWFLYPLNPKTIATILGTSAGPVPLIVSLLIPGGFSSHVEWCSLNFCIVFNDFHMLFVDVYMGLFSH
jgi:hypothetical protein